MQSFAFGVHTTPPSMDSNRIIHRADDIEVIQRMLTDANTSAVLLVGTPGVGKSTLAALIYHRLLLAKQADMSAPCYLVWLSVNSYTTLSDLLAAILYAVEVRQADIYLLTLEQQIALVLRALHRQQDNALIVIDQFESFVYPETSQGTAPQRELQLFLDLLQTDLGSSRILLTSSTAPFDAATMEQTRIRSYLVSRISIPEGVLLLQQHVIQGAPEELSIVWQRCAGHVFTLLLFCSLVEVGDIAPGYLVNAPEYQSLWHSEITPNIFALLYQCLTPGQKQVLCSLSLFSEPVPLQAVAMIITGGNAPTPEAGPFYANLGRELQILVNLSLVQSLQDVTLDAFFGLHPMLRPYVQAHYTQGTEQQPQEGNVTLAASVQPNALYEQSEAQQIALAEGHTRAASYYYALAQQLSKERRTTLQDVEPLLAAIRHLCLGREWQQACDLLFKEGLHESLVRWGAWNTLIGLYTALLPPFGIIALRDQGLLTSHLATLYGRIGDAKQSQTCFGQALKIQREVEDTHGEAVTLTNQGELLHMRGEWEPARINFVRAMKLSRQQPDQQQETHLQCIIQHNIGLLYHEANDHEFALHCYVQALRLSYKLPEPNEQGIILTNLGMLLCEQGQQREGVAVLLNALQTRKAQPDAGVVLLERFFIALEQRIGSNAYAQLCQSALASQQQIFVTLMKQVPA